MQGTHSQHTVLSVNTLQHSTHIISNAHVDDSVFTDVMVHVPEDGNMHMKFSAQTSAN